MACLWKKAYLSPLDFAEVCTQSKFVYACWNKRSVSDIIDNWPKTQNSITSSSNYLHLCPRFEACGKRKNVSSLFARQGVFRG